jgi:hypothetical protein
MHSIISYFRNLIEEGVILIVYHIDEQSSALYPYIRVANENVVQFCPPTELIPIQHLSTEYGDTTFALALTREALMMFGTEVSCREEAMRACKEYSEMILSLKVDIDVSN